MTPIKVYLDNNIYNYLVDEITFERDDIDTLINAVDNQTIQVVFSPVNLFEIVRCYENKDDKAKRMIEISIRLSKNITKLPNEILIDYMKILKAEGSIQASNLYYDRKTIFDEIRNGILNVTDYIVPQTFHEDVKKYDYWYRDSLMKMKNNIIKYLGENTSENVSGDTVDGSSETVDFYKAFNTSKEWREKWVKTILRDRCGFTGNIPPIDNFDIIPSLSVFLKLYFTIAKELIIEDKSPKSGDWADLDQSVYFSFLDYIVTSDTGKSGLFPNYRAILNDILRPMKISAVKFNTFIKKIENSNI